MESLPVLTVADLRAHTVMEWDQDVQLSFALPGRPALVVALASNLVVPMPMFKYQLQQAVYEGTSNGGVKWWCKRVAFPCGAKRKPKFEMSIRFECPHARTHYVKQVTDSVTADSRKSKHTSCVDCPVFVRFQGSKTSDRNVAVVVTATFKQNSTDPLRQLRNEFQSLQHCIYAEILGSRRFVFVFENCCLAQDASAYIQGRDHPLFQGKLSAEQQERYIFSVYKCNLKHEKHICPSLPSQRGMFMSYQVTQEVADLASAGATPAAIINFLTRSGQRGMISAAKVHHLRATIQSDIDVYSSIRPSTRDSHGQVLLNMLDQRRRQKKDVDYIFLYTEFDEKLVQTIANGDEDDVEFQSIRMQTGHGDDAGSPKGFQLPVFRM